MKLNDISVTHRIYAAFGVMMVMMVFLVAIAVGGTRAGIGNLDSYLTATANANRTAMARDSLNGARLALAGFERHPEAETLAGLQDALASLELASVLSDLAADFDRYSQAVGEMIALYGTVEVVVADMEAAGITATETLGGLIAETSQAANLNARAAALSGLAMQNILQSRLAAGALMDGDSAGAFARADAGASAATDMLAQLRGVFFRTEDVARVDGATGQMIAYRDHLRLSQERVAQLDTLRMTLDEIDNLIVERHAHDVAARQQMQDTVGQRAKDEAALSQMLALGVGGAVLLTGAALAIGIARWLSGFIRITAANMHSMASGQMDVELKIPAATPEMRQMVDALVVFRDNGLAMAAMDRDKEAARLSEAQDNAARQRLQEEIDRVVEAALDGDFSVRIREQFALGELDGTARSVNALVQAVDDGLSETTTMLAAMARDDLSVRMRGDYRGAFKSLKSDANGLADRLSDIIGQLQVASRAVRLATGEIVIGTDDLTKRTSLQAATIESANATAGQLAQTVESAAQRTAEMAADAQSALSLANTGGSVIDDAMMAMARISASSDRISDIIKMIDGIAFQTNLLALNASVEAARAGEAGKGFAVVAIEVRRLAQSTAQASGEVKALIEQSAMAVQSGDQLVSQASATLKSILEALARNTQAMEGISNASTEQAAAISALSHSMAQLDQTTQRNAALAEQTNAALGQTELQVQALDAIVDIFEIGPRAAIALTGQSPDIEQAA